MTLELSKYFNKQMGVTKMKVAKNIEKKNLNKNLFLQCNILLNTYVISVFENFLCSPLSIKVEKQHVCLLP